MHVVVLGAGVVGMATAYYLSRQGCRVTVIGRGSDVGDGASFANAGQLSYSFTDALAKPEFLAMIPRLLFGHDQGVHVRFSPELIGWGLRFLRQCTSRRAEQNTIAVLKCAMRSATLLSQLRENVPFDFFHRPAGKLVLLSSEDELHAATAASNLKKSHGCETEILTVSEARQVEPALEHVSTEVIAAVYSRDDEVADAQKFATELKSWLESQGSAEFRLSATVRKLLIREDRVRAAIVDDDEIEADAFVVCMGAWSQPLLRSVGVNPHVFPVRGYSITLPPGEASPSVSMTALKHRMVLSRIDGFVRVAGFADFTGFDTSDDSQRARTLLSLARQFAPRAADYDSGDASVWGGFRPMTPSGQPRVGPTAVDRLFVNTGHGMLGWTLACASGYDAAQAIANIH